MHVYQSWNSYYLKLLSQFTNTTTIVSGLLVYKAFFKIKFVITSNVTHKKDLYFEISYQ